jgi:hypothetical protein
MRIPCLKRGRFVVPGLRYVLHRKLQASGSAFDGGKPTK